MSAFYDQMASLYHLIFPNWNESIERLADQLTSIIHERLGAGPKTVLDVSCGIGTQAIGLAKHGFVVTASDLSHGAISRAKVEAQRRGFQIDFSVCDMRAVHAHHQRQFDVVVSADNSITHLLTHDDVLLALREMSLGFAVVQLSSATVIGGCGFKGPPDPDGIVEISYGIDPDYRGKGYATEAAEALVRYAFGDSRVRVVLAHTFEKANASTRVLNKCGFRYTTARESSPQAVTRPRVCGTARPASHSAHR